MRQCLVDLRKKIYTGMVGGSNLAKQKGQLGDNGKYKAYLSNR